MTTELLIRNGSVGYLPVTKDGIKLDLERKGVPGKLTFSVLDDGLINFTEGNPVYLRVDGAGVFYGFVFSKKRSQDDSINVTAYDQLRYLKNKDTYVYSNKTASSLIKMIAADFRLNLGDIEDTRYLLPSRVEDNQTLFDMIQNALDITLTSQKQMFILYDDFGKLTLKNAQNMRLNLLVDAETAENYDYVSSIDNNVYNKIKLSHDNSATGKRDIFIAQDSSHMNEWGVLQYYDTVNSAAQGKTKADALLSLYNQKERTLSISKVFGDLRVRGGSLVAVRLALGDMTINNFMMVERVVHSFSASKHTMDLTLRGGGFIA